MFFNTHRKRQYNVPNVSGILTKAKEYGGRAGQILGNVERIYRKLEAEVPSQYRADIERGINSANNYLNQYNRVVNAF